MLERQFSVAYFIDHKGQTPLRAGADSGIAMEGPRPARNT